MNQDPDQMKNRIAELTRKLTVLRVNERSLARRYTILQEAETSLRKENNKLKNEVTAIEAAITQRVGYLSRYKVSQVPRVSKYFCAVSFFTLQFSKIYALTCYCQT